MLPLVLSAAVPVPTGSLPATVPVRTDSPTGAYPQTGSAAAHLVVIERPEDHPIVDTGADPARAVIPNNDQIVGPGLERITVSNEGDDRSSRRSKPSAKPHADGDRPSLPGRLGLPPTTVVPLRGHALRSVRRTR